MKSIASAVAVCLFASAAAGAPADEYAAIFREYSPISGGMRMAETDLGRKEAVTLLGSFAPKFLDLAEKYPEDPIALKSMQTAAQIVVSRDSGAFNCWITNREHFPGDPADGSAARLVEILLRDHLESDQLGPVLDRMRYGYRFVFGEGLEAVLERSPHPEMQGLACLALAQHLNDRLKMAQVADARPELVERFAAIFGRGYLEEIRRRRDAGLAEKIEALFERAAAEFPKVKFRDGTVGETAKSELNEIRNLSIGKVAPEIEGPDESGVTFKLSDYRGRVVLLYFWSEF